MCVGRGSKPPRAPPLPVASLTVQESRSAVNRMRHGMRSIARLLPEKVPERLLLLVNSDGTDQVSIRRPVAGASGSPRR